MAEPVGPAAPAGSDGPEAPSRSRRKRSRSRGQSLVEFALIFPAFILILSGILDFGFMLYSRMTVINATREGARYAVTHRDPATSLPGLVDSKIRSVASGLTLANLPTVNPTCIPLAQAACDFTAGGSPDPLAGDAIRVTTNYTYRSFFPLLFGTTFNLSSTVQMVLE